MRSEHEQLMWESSWPAILTWWDYLRIGAIAFVLPLQLHILYIAIFIL